MKNLSGKAAIGSYYNVPIYINFDDLFFYKGEKTKRMILEKRMSRFLLAVSSVLIVLPILLMVLSGSFNLMDLINPKVIVNLFPWLSIPLILYAMYLVRNREEFDRQPNEHTIHDLKELVEKNKVKDIQLDKYFSTALSSSIDFFYYKNDPKFFWEMTNYLLDTKYIRILLIKRLGLNIDSFKQAVNQHLNTIDTSFEHNFTKLFFNSLLESVYFDTEKIDEIILFFAILKKFLQKPLLDLGITNVEQEGLRVWLKNETKKNNYYNKWKVLSKLKPVGSMNRAYTSKATPTLDTYSTDLTKEAAGGVFTTSIGRDLEMNQLFQVIQKGGSSAALVLGEPGVGKTRFLKYLATRMVVEDVPKGIQDYRLITVDLNKVLTQTGNVDTFKNTLQKILEEASNSGNMIIVFEEIGQIMNIREDGKMEVVNLLINAINNLKIQVVATTNSDNLTRLIKPIKPLASLFEVIEIKEPTSDLATQILIDEVSKLEKSYGIEIQVNAIKKIVEFAPRFDHDRVMPDKGIDLLEEGVLMAKTQGLRFVNVTVIDQLLSSKVGVNVGAITSDEAVKLKSLEAEMHKRVVGQDDAVKAVANSIKRSRSGLVNAKRPIASFLFFGPTGVGKTEVAKTLAEVYYGDEKMMVRLDMSEYQEEANLNRLIGYTDQSGNFVGGFLTEAVRSKPFSLVLLDEIEKSNPKVWDLLLQILDEGQLTDGMGRKVDFTNTMIISTSNAASKDIANLVGQGMKYNDIFKNVTPKLKDVFRVELLNRFDRVIMFKSLTKEEIRKVVAMYLEKVNKTLESKGIVLSYSEKTLDVLAESGYNPVYGARELRRVVQEKIEDTLADLIIDGKLKSGNEIVFDGVDVREIK